MLVGIYATTNGADLHGHNNTEGQHAYFSRWRYTSRGQEADLGTFVRTRESTVAGLKNGKGGQITTHEMELCIELLITSSNQAVAHFICLFSLSFESLHESATCSRSDLYHATSTVLIQPCMNNFGRLPKQSLPLRPVRKIEL